MPRPDDCTLTEEQRLRVVEEARRALNQADAMGVFPTPVSQIMKAANLEEVHEDVLNPTFVEKIRASVGESGQRLKRALNKVIGLFDARSSLVFIDRTLHQVKQTFVRLHETAHGFLPWQKPLYAVVEDSKESLDPNVADAFDREANVFASEVLFQLDSFQEETMSHDIGIFVPVKASKKYGASIYASIRQYVSKHHKTCAVLVLDPPELKEGIGFEARLRRAVASESFRSKFALDWPHSYSPDDQIGRLVPIGTQRASRPQPITLIDLNGQKHEFLAEAFTQKWQVFILIHHQKALTASTILLPA